MEFLNGAQDFFAEWYPTLLTVGGGILAFVAALVVIWSQIKPILDSLSAIKEKLKGAEVSDVTKLLQQNDMATKITDLKAKINNPTTSDELRQEYIVQLTTAMELKAKLDAGLVKAEEITDKYL